MSANVVRVLIMVAAYWASIAVAGAQQARVISASFFDPANPDTGPLLSTTYAGVPPSVVTVPAPMRVSNWNNLPALYPVVSGSQLDLFDSLGVITTIDTDWIATDVGANSYVGGVQGGTIEGNGTLMNGHLQSSTLGSTGLITVTVRDLANTIDTAAGYDVFVYADAESAGSSQSLLVDDGIHVAQALTIIDSVDGVPAPHYFDESVDYQEANFINGRGNWARFTGLTGDSFRIDALATSLSNPAYLNGFQIVGQPLGGSTADGDLNADGVIDGGDFLQWQRDAVNPKSAKHLVLWESNWGGTPVRALALSVPEPTTTTMVGLSAVMGGRLARRSRPERKRKR